MAKFDVNDFEFDDENVTAATIETLSSWEAVLFGKAAKVRIDADAVTIADLEDQIEALENP